MNNSWVNKKEGVSKVQDTPSLFDDYLFNFIPFLPVPSAIG